MPDQLTIGEVFPADDLVGQWVFSVSMVADDVHAVTAAQQEAIAGGDPRWMLFLQRALVVRLYEARRLVYTVNTNPELESFVAGNPFFDDLRRCYEPIDASPVDELYANLRHQSVHYMWPGSEELTETLRDYARMPAAKLKLTTDQQRFDVGWAQVVTGLTTLGDRSHGGWQPRLKERGELGAAIAGRWMMLLTVVVPIYARLKDLDLEQLIEVISDPRTEGGTEPSRDQPPR